MKKKTREALALLKRGDGTSAYIELAVLIMVLVMFLAFAISFLSVYAKHNLVNAMAHEIARFVEIKGQINSAVYDEFDRLKLAAGPTFSGATLSFDKSGKLDLEESFTVTVTLPQKFGIGGVEIIPVTVKAISTGRSEVYWK